jgi:hypothetical protein
VLVTVTAAPDTDAPVVSVTVPVIVPEYCCACRASGMASIKMQNSVRNITNFPLACFNSVEIDRIRPPSETSKFLEIKLGSRNAHGHAFVLVRNY